MISQQTENVLVNGSLAEIDELIEDMVTAIANRADVEDVITLLEDNGIEFALEADGSRSICKRKRPN